MGELTTKSFTSLDVFVEGSVVHALFAAGKKAPELFHARSDDGGATWRKPVRVDAGCLPPHRPKHGTDPQIVARGDRLLAVWTTKGSGFMGRGPMRTAVSDDGGVTWRAGAAPSPCPEPTGQAFVDGLVDRKGRIHLVWLGREGATIEAKAKKGLHHTVSTDGGDSWAPARAIDAVTCECCWNRLCLGRDGAVYVIYRDLDPRDLAIAKLDPKTDEWTRLGPAGDFGWEFKMCPHVGGAVCQLDASAVHALVWTGMMGKAGVHHVRLDGKDSVVTQLGSSGAKYPDMASSTDGGRLAAVWTDETEPEAVFTATTVDGGENWSEPRSISSKRAKSHHPRVVRTAAGWRAFWIEDRESRMLLVSAPMSFAD